MGTNNSPRGAKQGQFRPVAERNCPATVDLLAEWFGLPAGKLREWGVFDMTGSKGVGINYRDEDNAILFARSRSHVRATDNTRQPKGCPLSPYGLWRLAKARAVGSLILAEGESDCWCGWHHDLPFLGLPGANTAGCLEARHVAGFANIFVVREPDQGGDQFIAGAPERIRALGCKARIWEVTMPDPHKDPADLFRAMPARFAAVLAERMKAARELVPLPSTPSPSPSDNGASEQKEAPPKPSADKDPGPSPAVRLVELVRVAGVELFHDQAGDGWARLPGPGPRAVHKLESRGFTHYLRSQYDSALGAVVSKAALGDALGHLEMVASKHGKEATVHVRGAWSEGRAYYDLGGADWQAVAVGPDGWKLTANPPVLFRRPRGMKALPRPVAGGSFDEVWSFLNIADPEDRLLMTAWVLHALRRVPPFPILLLSGSAGCGKSTAARGLKRLIDPHGAELQSPPDSIRNLFVSAACTSLLCLDNLSKMTPSLSDAFCQIVTGGQNTSRKLYSGDEQEVLSACCPVVLTSIEDIATRGDLLSRSLCLRLPPLPGRHLTESGFWGEFDLSLPRVLGGAFDLLAKVLAVLPSVSQESEARMADYDQVGRALVRALGREEKEWNAAYRRNRDDLDNVALEAAVLTEPLLAFLSKPGMAEWEGTAKELLAKLDDVAGAELVKADGWPRRPQHLGDRLRRLAPNLLARGVVVCFDRQCGGNRTRLIRFGRPSEPPAGQA